MLCPRMLLFFAPIVIVQVDRLRSSTRYHRALHRDNASVQIGRITIRRALSSVRHLFSASNLRPLACAAGEIIDRTGPGHFTRCVSSYCSGRPVLAQPERHRLASRGIARKVLRGRGRCGTRRCHRAAAVLLLPLSQQYARPAGDCIAGHCSHASKRNMSLHAGGRPARVQPARNFCCASLGVQLANSRAQDCGDRWRRRAGR